MSDNKNNEVEDKEEKISEEADEILVANKEAVDEQNSDQENDENDENEKKLDLVLEELDSTKDKLLRALAENENTRRQMEKSRTESLKYGVQPLARELLNVVDNFERAIPKETSEKKEPLLEGFELIRKDILTILEKFNVKKISALGDAFDANFHQAMFEKQSKDYETGKVCEIIQDGYVFHDRLLRPSLVAVSKKIEEEKSNISEVDSLEPNDDVKDVLEEDDVKDVLEEKTTLDEKKVE